MAVEAVHQIDHVLRLAWGEAEAGGGAAAAAGVGVVVAAEADDAAPQHRRGAADFGEQGADGVRIGAALGGFEGGQEGGDVLRGGLGLVFGHDVLPVWEI